MFKQLNQNNIKRVSHDSKCEHKWSWRTYKVLFFAGGYKCKMKKCKRCKEFVPVDMLDHVNGQHHYSQPIGNGFYKCNQCDLAVNIAGGKI